jgi:hypothetical protein
MPVTWNIITTTSTSWISVTGGIDDWLDPRLTQILTESGAFLLAENEDFICTEAVSLPPSPWVPL